MKIGPWAAVPLTLFLANHAVAEKKDLSPPPLNPHPKEALHVTVSFDRPEDAKRYAIVMRAHYQNQQAECGYTEDNWNRRFIYPEGTFEIPNKSRDPRRAKFDIYLDRYNQRSCNWEFASPDFLVHDIHTGLRVVGYWGDRSTLAPGATYKAICPFREGEHARRCFGGGKQVPDTPFFNEIPASQRIPVTVHVSADSTPLRPRASSFFGKILSPMASGDATLRLSTDGDDQ